jgi:hypothetical protein
LTQRRRTSLGLLADALIFSNHHLVCFSAAGWLTELLPRPLRIAVRNPRCFDCVTFIATEHCHGPPVEAHRQVEIRRQSKAPGKIESSRTIEAYRSRTIEVREQTGCVAKSCISGDGGQGEKTSTSVKTD